MSEIHFSADLDSSKLETAIKQSNKTVKDWAKDVEKAGVQADQGLGKMTKSFKEAISEQKTLIKSIEQDIKKLQKAYDDAIPGRQKRDAGRELNSVKKALAEEQATLIGLQRQQIEGNKQIEKSSFGVIDKIGKMALAYLTVHTIVKILKETVLSFFTKSQEGVELLERKINGFKAAVGVLQGEFIKLGKSLVGEKEEEATPWGTRLVKGIKVLATTANLIPRVKKYFDELTTSMNNAGKAAENYTRMEQEIADAERDLIVPRAKASAEIVKARLIYADDTKSASVRIAALEKALKLEDETAQEEIRHQQWKTLVIRDQNIELEKRGQLTDEDRKKLQESIAEEINLQKESDQRQVRATNSLMAARKEFYDKEKDELKKLQEEYTKTAEASKAIDSGKGFSILNRHLIKEGIIPATGTELTKGGADNFKLALGSAEWAKKMQKAIRDNDKDRLDNLKKELDLRTQIVNAAANLVMQIGQQIGLDEKSMSLLNAGLSAFTILVTQGAAGIPQAALAMLSGIISQIPSSTSKFEAQIEHINQLLEEQARLINQSEQSGGQSQARKDELEILKEEKAVLIARRDHIQKYGGSIFWTNNKTHKEIEKLNSQIKEAENLIEDASSSYNEFATNTTASTIADAISQGFQDGKTSAANFAETFNDFMRTAINSALEEMSKPQIAAWYKQFAINMESGGGLTKEEISQLKIDWNKIITEGKANRDAVYSIAGISPISGTVAEKSLSMGIQRNISEQTGSELAGLFRRFADDNRATKDYTLAGLNNLTKIEANTFQTVVRLDSAIIELQNIVKNTKQSAVGAF